MLGGTRRGRCKRLENTNLYRFSSVNFTFNPTRTSSLEVILQTLSAGKSTTGHKHAERNHATHQAADGGCRHPQLHRGGR
jgi:hypothetical protein